MKNIGLFFNSNDAIQNEELIKKLKIENPESNFYSNYQSESINYFENKKEFHKDIRPFCKSKIDQLSIEFYKNHTNTPLFNDNFNFWVNLRFNIFLDLLNYYKIEFWINNLKLTYSIEELIFVNVNSKSKNIIIEFFPKSKFIYSESKEKPIKKTKILKNIAKMFFYGAFTSFSVFKKSKKTLLISKELDFTAILTKKGLVKEDKFIFPISELMNVEEYDRILDSNIFSIKNLVEYNYDKNLRTINFRAENILFLSCFKIKFYFEILKTFRFFKKNQKENNSFLSLMIKNNKKNVFPELIVYWMYFFYFKKKKYKNVVLSDEMSPVTNSIVRAAKKLNINVIGIQHGLLNEVNIAYNYSDKELFIDNPFPTKLIVWGNEELSFLDKNKRILKNTVQAKGNIVLDGLKYLPKKNENSIFTLLYATQPQPVMSQRLKSISDFTDAILKFDPINIKVIIRLHPREVFDYELYNLFFEKLNQFEVEIDKGEELFSQINKTDVLVTSYSTVSKDAIILNTPIILQDYYENDITGLISKGIAKKSTNSEELFCLINDIKTGNFKINIINYENVLKEIYASTDFKVANEIIKMLN